MDLQDESGATVLEPIDICCFPQGASPVESLHGDGNGHVEHVADRTFADGSSASKVVAEIEIRIDLPPGWSYGKRIGPDSLAQSGD